MEVNEAREKVNITDVEKIAVQKYLGFKSNKFDMLLDMEPYKLAKMLTNGEAIYENVDDILEDVEMLSNIYSAMIKNKKVIGKTLYLLVDNNKCVIFENTTLEFINAYFEEENAEKNIPDGKIAHITYEINGEFPYISIESFAGNNDLGDVILAPFANIKKFELISYENEYRNYEITLETGDLSKIDHLLDKKQEMEKEIVDKFDGFKEFVKYSKNAKKVIIDKAYKKACEFAKLVRQYAMVICREKEVIYNNAIKVIKEEEKVQDEINQNMLEDNYRRQAIRGMQTRIIKTPEKTNEFIDKLDKINELLDKENKYIYYAEKLRIPYNRRINPINIVKRLDDIKAAVLCFSESVDGIVLTEDMSIEEAAKVIEPVIDNIRKIESLDCLITGVDYLPYIYEDEMKVSMKEQIDRRAFDVIKALRMAKYNEELRNLSKISSFWDKVSGRDKIRELQIQNLKAKIELEKLKKYEPKRTYSVRDIISDLDSEMIILEKQTNEVLDFKTAITMVFEVDEKDIAELTINKVNKYKESLNMNSNGKNLIIKKSKENIFNKIITAIRIKTFKEKIINYLKNEKEILDKKIKAVRRKEQRRLRNEYTKRELEMGYKDFNNKRFLSDSRMYTKLNSLLKSIEKATVIGLNLNTKEGDI